MGKPRIVQQGDKESGERGKTEGKGSLLFTWMQCRWDHHSENRTFSIVVLLEALTRPTETILQLPASRICATPSLGARPAHRHSLAGRSISKQKPQLWSGATLGDGDVFTKHGAGGCPRPGVQSAVLALLRFAHGTVGIFACFAKDAPYTVASRWMHHAET